MKTFTMESKQPSEFFNIENIKNIKWSNSTSYFLKKITGKDFLITLCSFLIIWKVLSSIYSPLILPGPILTIKSLWKIIQGDRFLAEVFITVNRLLVGLIGSVAIGSLIGIIVGINQRARKLFEPFIYLIQSIPPILYMTLAMIWFGLDGQATMFIIFIASVPIMVINISEGFENIDIKLIEMGKSFQFSRRKMITTIILPSLITYFKSGFIIVMGLGWKLVIMGEVLSSSTGLGAQITDARMNLQTNMVFAWGAIVMVLCFLSQKLVALFFSSKDMMEKKL